MTQPRICPECKAEIPVDAPPGVCPYCALRAGLRWEDATRPDRQWGPSTPLTPEELGRRLPELEAFELIGPGGMGTVYKARHRDLDRPVAVKVLHAHLQDDATFAERFVREARTLARLDHPNIVRVYDFGHREGVYYLVMEFVNGATLREAIVAGGMAPKDALALVPRICEALQYAHDQGVVHRDIKPENILLDRSGAVKIADFGLAKLTGVGSTRLTQTAQVMGTPHYMAPEQIEYPTEVDHRADIYALGVVFYEMLTGELPVGRFPPPSKKVEVDVRLDEVVLRTLEKEPSLRYQQASDLCTAVESLSDPGAPRCRERRRRRRSRVDDYEYRSKRTLWGFPLIHVVHSGDPSGQRMRLARGIIAIGDVAVGVIAVGGFAFGGVTVGGMGAGLVSISGLSVGLLFALGGIALGGFSAGGVAFGFVTNAPGPDFPTGLSLLSLSPETVEWVSLFAWGFGTLVVTATAAVVILAFIKDPPRRVD
jgi:hypothetical protein